LPLVPGVALPRARTRLCSVLVVLVALLAGGSLPAAADPGPGAPSAGADAAPSAGPAAVARPASIGGPADQSSISRAVADPAGDLCAQVGHAAGYRSDGLVVAVAVALAESTCTPSATGTNGPTAGCPNGSTDRGLWQINSCYHPTVSNACAYDAQCNATQAYRISAGGRSWSPWATYTSGRYRSFLSTAAAAVRRLTPVALARPQAGFGVYRPSSQTFHLDADRDGRTDIVRGFGAADDLPTAGDWNRDARDTVGTFRPGAGTFHVTSSATSNSSDAAYRYGTAGDLPLGGDWDRDGVDTAAVFRPSTGVFYLNNQHNDTVTDARLRFGTRGDLPAVGDWDGDGDDTPAVFRPSTGLVYVDLDGNGSTDRRLRYGAPGDRPVAGDWDGNGRDGIAVFRPATGTYYADDGLDGRTDVRVSYGTRGDLPVAGTWGG